MELEDLKDRAIDHKIASVTLLVVLTLAIGGLGVFFQSTGISSNQAEYSKTADTSLASSRGIGFPGPIGQDASSGSYVEVREGQIKINSENIEQDIQRLETVSSSFDGFVESSSKRETDLYTSADLTVRVPKDNFSGFMNSVNQEFKVESYNVKNYRLSTERETSELDILNSTMADYESIKKEVRAMDNNKEKLDLLIDITDKQLEVKERQRRFENDLSSKQARSDLATVDITLEEERKIDLMPDNLDNRAKNEVRDMFDAVATTLITTFTDGVVWFFKGFKLLVVLGALAVPAWIGLKLARALYQRF